jgi:hypothetical protein
MAQIDIRIQQARLHLEMPDRRMEIVSKRPEMRAFQEKPEVELDMDELKANMGLKTYDQMITEAAYNARTEARQGIRETVSQSKFIGDVTINGNKIAMVARDKMLEYSEPQMGHSPVPPGAVDMDGKPGTLEIEWSGYELSIDWSGEFMPEITVEPPSSVDVEISRPPRVKISVTEVYIPATSGRNVNTEV